ncbi:MAG TPA: TIM barrel protein [Opitutaceae bacterium]|nr:TIM barrel protein [Opitutaceae bacterium]
MTTIRRLLLISLSGFLTAMAQPRPEQTAAGVPPPGTPALFAPSNLLAWCIVPYDQKHRTPAERIAMLQRLGFTQYAWDWRQQHLRDLPEEIRLARASGIRLRAVWLWIDAQSDRVGHLGEANRAVFDAVNAAHLSVEFWTGFNANFFEGVDEPERVRRGAAMVAYLRDQAAPSGSTVALYNHGDWFGEPDNEIRIIAAVGDPSVGMVFNFHHAHTMIDAFPRLLPRMLPHLRAVNLNGMRPEGPKILPIGSGTREREMIRLLAASGYAGPIGILCHIEDADAEVVLRRNLEGLRALVGLEHP